MEAMMTLKEANRLGTIRKVETKEISLKKASEELGLSYKQAKRIWKRYKSEGVTGLISQQRGKPSNNRSIEIEKQKALGIIKEKYADYGPTLIKEKLEEKHGLKLSKETLRQLMIKAGIWKAKKIKEHKVYARRTRRSRIGELEQIDGSYDRWFEERGEKCCLLVCVDDASSALMHLQFCKAETTQDYLNFIKFYIEQHGRPLAFYSDKHSVFRINNKKRIEGSFSTRVHEVLKELDIELICAHSPQAKGRVERANGTLQDRLIKELRERGISGMEEGNDYLEEFIQMYNKKFSVEPASRENAHRKLYTNHKAKHLFMVKEERTLSKDLAFQYRAEVYQIESKYRHRLCGKKIEVYESEGTIKMVLQDGKELKYKKWREKAEQPAEIVDTKELEILWPTRKATKKNHPWRSWKYG